MATKKQISDVGKLVERQPGIEIINVVYPTRNENVPVAILRAYANNFRATKFAQNTDSSGWNGMVAEMNRVWEARADAIEKAIKVLEREAK